MAEDVRSRGSARRLAFGTPTGFVALGLGSGLAPVAPGTAGSLAALPLAWPLMQLAPLEFWILWVVFFALGVWCCSVVARRLGSEDPGAIVWDEMVALWAVLVFVPLQWGWWLAAFALFRLFDIVKPWPIRILEHRFREGLGIMIDDVVAALYALALLIPARLWFVS
ncbi:phosphatidylglycerophosphatase A family protein [Elongatibacter sediminis]|uniref:Phosphatidylglycerophosphatase A n=1 Tax=Elongatibacter sediminis TaxID=3119006 RepID=A0AAW9RN99_9GAMM